MSETKWTPGPWQVDAEYLDDVRDVTGVNLVAQAYCIPSQRGGGHIRRANARLIAAAPDLYAALESLPLAAFDKDMDDIDAAEFVDHAGDFIEAMQKARSALKKARGEA